MKKRYLSILPLTMLLYACQTTTSNTSNIPSSGTSSAALTSKEESSSSAEITSSSTSLEEEYGVFSIDGDAILSNDEKTYTINVGTSKKEITISGYYEGNFVVQNGENLESFKGVKLVFNHACIVSENGNVINYGLTGSNIEIVSNKETSNYIINKSTDEEDIGIYSDNNIELNLKKDSILNILTKGGHGLKADKDVKVYGKGHLNITSAHDALHGRSFISSNGETGESLSSFEGVITITDTPSQAFDFSTKKTKGSIDISSGTYVINNTESVFKTDISLSIAQGVIITATNITGSPVVKGDNSSGITITNSGTFTVNGNEYTETSI